MMNDKRMKTVHELYGCANKNKTKQHLKFAKKLFIRRYNEGYSAVYIYQQLTEWANIPLTGDLIDHWLQSPGQSARTTLFPSWFKMTSSTWRGSTSISLFLNMNSRLGDCNC